MVFKIRLESVRVLPSVPVNSVTFVSRVSAVGSDQRSLRHQVSIVLTPARKITVRLAQSVSPSKLWLPPVVVSSPMSDPVKL